MHGQQVCRKTEPSKLCANTAARIWPHTDDELLADSRSVGTSVCRLRRRGLGGRRGELPWIGGQPSAPVPRAGSTDDGRGCSERCLSSPIDRSVCRRGRSSASRNIDRLRHPRGPPIVSRLTTDRSIALFNTMVVNRAGRSISQDGRSIDCVATAFNYVSPGMLFARHTQLTHPPYAKHTPLPFLPAATPVHYKR